MDPGFGLGASSCSPSDPLPRKLSELSDIIYATEDVDIWNKLTSTAVEVTFYSYIHV